MKLFIINKRQFDNHFNDDDRMNSRFEPLTRDEVFSGAVKQLSMHLAEFDSIPNYLQVVTDTADSVAMFEFSSRKKDINGHETYFYTFLEELKEMD